MDAVTVVVTSVMPRIPPGGVGGSNARTASRSTCLRSSRKVFRSAWTVVSCVPLVCSATHFKLLDFLAQSDGRFSNQLLLFLQLSPLPRQVRRQIRYICFCFGLGGSGRTEIDER